MRSLAMFCLHCAVRLATQRWMHQVTGAFGASALGEVLKEVESTDGMIDFEESTGLAV